MSPSTSCVSPRASPPVASVQNGYSLLEQDDDPTIDLTAAEGIAHLPYGPLGGERRSPGAPTADSPSRNVDEIARRLDLTAAQVAISWLLQRSPNVVPIRGSTNIAHVTENGDSPTVTLNAADLAAIGDH